MNKVRVALVEIGRSHDECLLTQVRALQTIAAEIHLICDKEVRSRNVYQQDAFAGIFEVNTTGAAIGDVRLMRGIVRYLKENKIEKVVFNTAQGGHIRNLALMLPKSISCYGIIHTIRKFNESFTQKIIHRAIKRYAVLSDDLLKRVKSNSKLHVQSFYPIEFPIEKNHETNKPENEVWIAIPGGVETRRKDLQRLPGMIAQTPENVKFIFLGKTDFEREDVKAFIREIHTLNLQNQLQMFGDFIPSGKFFSILAETDYLLPLVHPDTPSADQYIVNQISGSFSLSFGLKKPLLIHQAYQSEEDLQKAAFFYAPENFQNDFNEAEKHYTKKTVEIDSVNKWKTAFQHSNFLKFIELI